MITATLNASGVKEKLNGSANKILSRLKDTLYSQTGMLANYIRASKLGGQVLKNQTGNLRNSIKNDVTVSGSELTGLVFVDNTAGSKPGQTVKYANAQEYGAHIPERRPVNAKALRWYAGGSPVFAMYARAFDLPARPFMRPSLEEKSPEITAALQNSLNEAIQE